MPPNAPQTKRHRSPSSDPPKYHAATHAYRKMIGGVRFSFSGVDLGGATQRAEAIAALYVADIACGEKGWTPAALNRARNVAKGTRSDDAPNAPTIAPVNAADDTPSNAPLISSPLKRQSDAARKASPTLTVYDALRLYLAHGLPADDNKGERAKADARWSICYLIGDKATEHSIPHAAVIPNMPLEALDLATLNDITATLKRRPKGKTGAPMSTQYIIHFLLALRSALKWMDDPFGRAGKLLGGWTPPAGWERCMRWTQAQRKRQQTPAEQLKASQPPAFYSIKELAALWQNAFNAKRRAYLLLALNCGFSHAEIASLLVGECNLDAETPTIRRIRRKAGGVAAEWALWSETADALRRIINPFDGPFDRAWLEASPDYRIVKDDSGTEWVQQRAHNGGWRHYDIKIDEWLAEQSDYQAERMPADTDCVFTTSNGNSLMRVSGSVNTIALIWSRWRKSANIKDGGFSRLRKTGAQLVQETADGMGLDGIAFGSAYLAHGLTGADKHYMGRRYMSNGSGAPALDTVLAAVRQRLTFLDKKD